MSGIFYNDCGEFNYANFGQILRKCMLFRYKFIIKIPLLCEIQPFDNTEKVYESISGHTFENGSSEKPGR